MADNKSIHFIPPLPPKREKRVGIYCRVSTNSIDQLKSFTAQVSALTRLTAANPKWFQNCKSRDIEIILTKSISRFGRDTVEILNALSQLRFSVFVLYLNRKYLIQITTLKSHSEFS